MAPRKPIALVNVTVPKALEIENGSGSAERRLKRRNDFAAGNGKRECMEVNQALDAPNDLKRKKEN